MELYNRNIMPFDAYLDVRAGNSVNEALATATSYQIASLSKGFGAVIASQQVMTSVMSAGFGAVTFGLAQINRNIESLHSDFNWAMGEVLSKLEMQQKALQEIATMLQAPLDTQAKELRRRAEFAYQNGWYQEALADFLQAEQQNYQDFMVHQAIANIYLYHERPADLTLSREYYLKAAKYAFPVSKYHAALAHMYAGFVCYLQRDDVAAIQNAARATQIYPKLSEAYFNHAKFAASAGQAKVAIPSLETAIRSDRKYAVKARADSDFEYIAAQVTELMNRLVIESRKFAESKVQKVRTVGQVIRPTSAQQLISQAVASAESSLRANTYLENLDALDALKRVDYLADTPFYDKDVVVSQDSMVVNGEKFSLHNVDRVVVKKRREGWTKVIHYFDLYEKAGKHIYRISSENKTWVEEIATAVNQVLRH